MKEYSPYQFAFFRIGLGSYLFFHFLSLVPYAPEMFSDSGILPVVDLNPTHKVFPNILSIIGTPLGVQGFILLLAILSLLFATGFYRRIAAVLLWYGWACLFNRIILIGNPGMPFIGWLLLACAIIPSGEPLNIANKKNQNCDWIFPKILFIASWVLMSFGYSLSGIHKLGSPSWVDGSALFHVLNNPLARDNFIREILIQFPALLKVMTWGSLALEVLFVPLCLLAFLRLGAWLAMVGMHVGILFLVNFPDLTIGILMIHWFTFDPRWLPPRKTKSPIIFFDGVCGLCNRFIDFLISEDHNKIFRYSPLQGETAKNFIDEEEVKSLKSMVLHNENGIQKKSDAILNIFSHLGGVWGLARFFLIIPKSIRDGLYDILSSNRYKIFGKKETCRLPSLEERSLFLD